MTARQTAGATFDYLGIQEIEFSGFLASNIVVRYAVDIAAEFDAS